MVPDDSLTIRERAVAAWPPAWHGQNLRDILVSMGIDVDVPWRELPKKTRDWILFTEEQPTVPVYAGFTPAETRTALRARPSPAYMGTFTGARRYVLHTFATTQSPLMKRRVARFMTGAICPACDGKRLKKEALSVTFAGLDIGALVGCRSIASRRCLRRRPQGASMGPKVPRGCAAAQSARPRTTAPRRAPTPRAASPPAARRTPAPSTSTARPTSRKKSASPRSASPPTSSRASRRCARSASAISRSTAARRRSRPGELQRLRLATQIRSNLFGVVYVLDEPTAGLHPKDGAALLEALDALKRSGNSIFVVEHDLATMRRADWIVDVGPDAGERGGRILYSGPPGGLARIAESHTARYLFDDGPRPADPPPRRRRGWLVLAGITRNNLVGLDARFPLGVLTAVTGVSGSGKSSLVSEALVELVCRQLGHEPASDDDEPTDGEPTLAAETQGRIASGMERIQRLVRVDQKPIGRTPRSNLATYTGLFDGVRKLFAATPMARSRRYDAGRFSFNVAKGRCDTCEGEGFVSVELLFMPSVYAPCPTCQGARYNAKTLEVMWRDRSIADVLGLTVECRLRLLRRRAVGAASRSPCCATSGSATSASASPRPSSRAARRNGSSSPPSCRSSSAAARSTSSTSRPPASIPPTSTS